MPFGLPTPSLLPTLPTLSPSPIDQHTPKITTRLTIKTVAQMGKVIARAWNRPLLWLALPLAIVGHDPANAQMMPTWLNRDLTVPIKPGGRGREVVRFGARREMSLPIVTQAIEAAPQERDRSMPDGVVRFEPPTDDDIGETGSGATRSSCVGVFALLPAGNANPSGVQMFPPQRLNQAQIERLELFVYVNYVNSGAQGVDARGNTPDRVRLIDLGLIDRNASLETSDTSIQQIELDSLSRRQVQAANGGYILRVNLAADPKPDTPDRQFDWFMNICPTRDAAAIEQFGELNPLENPIPIGAETVAEYIDQAQTLAKAGLWLDTLVTLDDARRLATLPEEIALVEANWVSLFESIHWDFATYPIADVPILTIEELNAQAEAIGGTEQP